MAEPPPRPPEDDETVVLPHDETVVDPDWAVAPERRVAVDEVEHDPGPPRRPVVWPWLLALLVLVLAGLAAAFLLTRDEDEPAATTSPALGASTGRETGTTTGATTTQPETVRVPEVVGLPSSEATARLREAGFEVRLASVASQEPAGTVVGQAPSAGAEAERGSEVRLDVAQQPEGSTRPATTAAPEPQPATVPDVVGQELADAARAFGDEGLKVSVRYVPSNEAQGRVVAQARPAGTETRRGDTVQVNVSTGAEPPPAATVPTVVGRPLVDAREALEAAGYEVLAIDLEDEVRNEDRVASQTPGGGASVPRGSLVVLYLAG